MARKPLALSRRSPILRTIRESQLNPMQRLRARARENDSMAHHPAAHPSIVASQKRVNAAERSLQKAMESRDAIKSARLRAKSMADSAALWPTGTQWIKKSGAWVRKKTIPVMHPIHSVRGSRVDARTKVVESRKAAKKAQHEGLSEAAKLSETLIHQAVAKRLPKIRARMLEETNDVIDALGKPPFHNSGKSRAQIARDFLRRVNDPEQLVKFDRILQGLRKSIERKDVNGARDHIERLNNL